MNDRPIGRTLTIADAIKAALRDLGMPCDDVHLHSRASYEWVTRIAAELTSHKTVRGRMWHTTWLN